MEDRGWRIAGGHKAGAAVVCRSNNCSRAFGSCGGEHGARDLFGRTKCDSADCRTRSAQECSERAGGFGDTDHVVEEWDQLLAKRLVQVVDESAVKFFVIPRGKCGGDGAGVPAVFHGFETIDPGRQDAARLFCGDLEIWNQEHEM